MFRPKDWRPGQGDGAPNDGSEVLGIFDSVKHYREEAWPAQEIVGTHQPERRRPGHGALMGDAPRDSVELGAIHAVDAVDPLCGRETYQRLELGRAS